MKKTLLLHSSFSQILNLTPINPLNIPWSVWEGIIVKTSQDQLSSLIPCVWEGNIMGTRDHTASITQPVNERDPGKELQREQVKIYNAL